MNETILYTLLYLFGVIISAFSQILLKKSADVKRDKWYQEYLNWRVIAAYAIFVVATLCSVTAFRVLPLSMGPILGATEYVFIALLSWLVLKEKISVKKLIGLGIIIAGVVVFSL
ncbi:MAG: EamA family transporter [Eubacteriales bacterium]|nr:EamA family transporter [Eubacteriales bacterium]